MKLTIEEQLILFSDDEQKIEEIINEKHRLERLKRKYDFKLSQYCNECCNCEKCVRMEEMSSFEGF